MDTAVDQWLTRFAAGAGSQYQWELVEVETQERTIELMIRAYVTDEAELCPLSAQATYELGEVYDVGAYHIAATLQGVEIPCRAAIVAAADDDKGADADVRDRLLRICRLTEQVQVEPVKGEAS